MTVESLIVSCFDVTVSTLPTLALSRVAQPTALTHFNWHISLPIPFSLRAQPSSPAYSRFPGLLTRERADVEIFSSLALADKNVLGPSAVHRRRRYVACSVCVWFTAMFSRRDPSSSGLRLFSRRRRDWPTGAAATLACSSEVS